MAGLVPAISMRDARHFPRRDRRDKPGDDTALYTALPRADLLSPHVPRAIDVLAFRLLELIEKVSSAQILCPDGVAPAGSSRVSRQVQFSGVR